MTIEEARRKIAAQIVSVYDNNEANNIAEIAIEYVSGLPRVERISSKGMAISKAQEETIWRIIERLQKHEPIQYIINEAWFAGLKLFVDNNVLIPRPETEELVEWMTTECKSQKSKVRILDVGTGSGCIAIAVKKKLQNAEVWACDVSDEALNVARMNADALHLAIDFVPLNFLDQDQRIQLPRVDIIVSNPPYVPEQNRNEMKKNVLDFEPPMALFVPDNDPLVFYKAIADFAKEKLNNNGSIYVEIHENLGERVQNLFQSKGYSVEVTKDLQGKDRMIKVII